MSFPYLVFVRTELRQCKSKYDVEPQACRPSEKSHRSAKGLSCRVQGFWLAIALLAAMAGCSHAKKVISLVTPRRPINLNVGIDPEANGNSPVALDVVLIKDKNFWKTAPGMSAKDWFDQKKDLQRRYGDKLEVYFWEWVPGQSVSAIRVKVPRRFSGAMVFANYQTPGTHSAPIPLGSKVIIGLQQNDFVMEIEP